MDRVGCQVRGSRKDNTRVTVGFANNFVWFLQLTNSGCQQKKLFGRKSCKPFDVVLNSNKIRMIEEGFTGFRLKINAIMKFETVVLMSF
ncbi:hypothetical protein [Labrenzia sp. OB1]|uniref:hypothetical protein n=1 Tax=Labrenzia sp. OB1 TaxID=1561204 RepID=UPI0007B21DAF|nr:hypothetical protein [Labrenzia sp. OB1]KZM48321.1 hypothetical protein OA90_21535 [Labrenzia sp. OB1]